MKKFFLSPWFLVIVCIAVLVGAGFATYYTPEPFGALTACVIGLSLGFFIRWWISNYFSKNE